MTSPARVGIPSLTDLSPSADASKFLAQSQSRFSSFADQAVDPNQQQQQQPQGNLRYNNGNSNAGVNAGGERYPGRRPNLLSAPSQKSFLWWAGYPGNPYQQNGGGGSRFGNLGARLSVAPDAPLFQSTLEEEEDEQERDREAADLYALQRSRRLAAAQLAESTESEGLEGGRSRASMDESLEADDPYSTRALGRGIKSSWPGVRGLQKSRGDSGAQMEDRKLSRVRMGSTQTQHMVDVGLESFHDDDPPESLLGDRDDPNTPAFQRFKKRAERTPFMKRTITNDSDRTGFPLEPIAEDAPAQKHHEDTLASPEGEAFHHDQFFAWLFLITFAGMMSTFVLVLLNTSASSNPVGDTIYTTLEKSVNMLAVDTLVSVIVSLIWLAAIKSFVRPLVNLIIISVPIVMASFSIYTLVSSFQGQTHGSSLQDKVMRWFSIVPAVGCVGWIYLVARGRKSIQQAIEILQFSSKILAENSGLLVVGFGCLALVVAWTWAWLAMFTRVFMGGHFSKNRVRFVIEFSSWWLGAAFVLLYLWTLSVINGVHSATTAATVSQWYFHRNAGPPTPSKQIVSAALHHAMTTIFGSICESTLIALLIRAPSIFLPRVGNMISNAASCCMPAPVMTLTNPLTITYAAIHSHNLHTSARGLEALEIIPPSAPNVHPRVHRSQGTSNIKVPYQLAKLLLVATRLLMATGMGFAAWVMTAKQMHIDVADGVGLKGSAYAYVIGIVASFIGFSITGAIESILSDIVDAILICYGSERRMETGHGRYCLEAAYLFGERRGSMVDSDYA